MKNVRTSSKQINVFELQNLTFTLRTNKKYERTHAYVSSLCYFYHSMHIH